MKRIFALFLALALVPLGLFAQRTITQPNVLQTFNLTVVPSPSNAQIFINGSAVKGLVATNLPAGTYTLTVRAPGYQDFSTAVTVTANVTVPVTLQPLGYQLSVNVTNVKGAQVFLNGALAGNAPFSAQLSPGSYSLVVRAPGFMDYAENFALSGPKNVTTALQPMTASYQVVVPAANVNPEIKGGHWSQIQVYVDGALQKGNAGQVQPGRRLVRVTAGGMQAEAWIDFQAGGTYTIEPFMGVQVK